MEIQVMTLTCFYKIYTLVNFRNSLIIALQTSHQPPSNLVSNWKYGQFCTFMLKIWKFGSKPPIFSEILTLVNFHNCVISTLPNIHQPPVSIVSNSKYYQFYDFAGYSFGAFLMYFQVFRNNILLKHATDLNFSLEVVHMMKSKMIMGIF